jgi:hypothetical protein
VVNPLPSIPDILRYFPHAQDFDPLWQTGEMRDSGGP